jgi:sec-independent protein translocase protein TatA
MHMALVFIIALLVFGPKKLPEIGRELGKAIREFKKASREVMENFHEAMEERPQPLPTYDSYNPSSYPETEFRAEPADVAARWAETPRPAEAAPPAEGSPPGTVSRPATPAEPVAAVSPSPADHPHPEAGTPAHPDEPESTGNATPAILGPSGHEAAKPSERIS